MDDITTFTYREWVNALGRLGFQPQPTGKELKFRHPEIKPQLPQGIRFRPYVTLPRGVEKDKDFQKQVIKDLERWWGIPRTETIKALKGK